MNLAPLAPKANITRTTIPVSVVNFTPAENKQEDSIKATRNTLGWRQPNWTELEVRTLLLECDRYRDVMVSRNLNAPEEQKKPKEEKQKVWQIITEAVNHVHMNTFTESGHKHTVMRTVKCVVKKWVNLINKMRHELGAMKRNPRNVLCPTSRAVNTILHTSDPLDLDKILGPLPQAKEPRPAKEPSPDALDYTNKKLKYRSIAPLSSGVNEEALHPKRKAEELPSSMNTEQLPHPPWLRKRRRKYNTVRRKNLKDDSDCWQRRIPNGNIIGLNSVFPANNLKVAIPPLPRNPIQNIVIKNDAVSNNGILFIPSQTQPNQCNNAQNSAVKNGESVPNSVPNSVPSNVPNNVIIKQEVEDDVGDGVKVNDDHVGQSTVRDTDTDRLKDSDQDLGVVSNSDFGVMSNEASMDENDINSEAEQNQNPEFYNGDVYTDDFMQLNKEVLELKKQKLLTKIDKLKLEREKAAYDKERSIIEKKTAVMAQEKLRLELEALKKSLGIPIHTESVENVQKDSSNDKDTIEHYNDIDKDNDQNNEDSGDDDVNDERSYEEEMIAGDSDSQELSSDECSETTF